MRSNRFPSLECPCEPNVPRRISPATSAHVRMRSLAKRVCSSAFSRAKYCRSEGRHAAPRHGGLERSKTPSSRACKHIAAKACVTQALATTPFGLYYLLLHKRWCPLLSLCLFHCRQIGLMSHLHEVHRAIEPGCHHCDEPSSYWRRARYSVLDARSPFSCLTISEGSRQLGVRALIICG